MLDFYNDVNKKWLLKVKIEKDETIKSTFNDISLKIDKIMKNIMKKKYTNKEIKKISVRTNKDLNDANKLVNVVNDFYKSSKTKSGFVFDFFEFITSIDDNIYLLAIFTIFNIPNLIKFSVNRDMKNRNKILLSIMPCCMTLSYNKYYKIKEYKIAFKKYITQVYKHFYKKINKKEINEIYKTEIKLALSLIKMKKNKSKKKPKLTNGNIKKNILNGNWNRYIKLVNKLINMKMFFKNKDENVEISPKTKINFDVSKINYFKELNSVFKNPDRMKLYLLWKYMNYSIIYTGKYTIKEKFWKTFNGKIKILSPEKKLFEICRAHLSDVLGVIYDSLYDNIDLTNLKNIIENIKIAFTKRLKNSDWLSDKTKSKALNKLKKMKFFLVKPKNYDDIFKMYNIELTDDLFTNVLIINNSKIKYKISKLYNSNYYDSFNTLDVNAYHEYTSNSVIIPAGILSKPIYDDKKNNYNNYGSIGVIIGHEIIHGFDLSGRLFDEKGELMHWWTNKDTNKYLNKVGVLIEQYSNLGINGMKTVSENIADNGGLSIAIDAYKNFNPDYTDSDIIGLFKSFAVLMRSKIRRKYYEHNINTDSHSPSDIRVNQALYNNEVFNEIFMNKNLDVVSIW